MRFILSLVGIFLGGLIGAGTAMAQDPRALASLLCEMEAKNYSKLAEYWSETRQKAEKIIREDEAHKLFTPQQLTEIMNKVMQTWFEENADAVYKKKQESREELRNLNEEPSRIALMVAVQGFVLRSAAKIGLEQPGLSKLRYQRLLEESCKGGLIR